MEDFKFTAEETSFIVEAEGKKLRVSFEDKNLNWEDAQKWCKENGGGDESVDNLRLLAKYREPINKELEALGKEILGGWIWSNERAYINPFNCAFGVNLSYGDVGNDNQDYYSCVRAVSAL
jgi:hypothetical protein